MTSARSQTLRLPMPWRDVMVGRATRWLLGVWLAVGTASVAAAELPRPEELVDDVAFWRDVYTKISTSQGYLHDDRELGIVYETIQFNGESPERQKKLAADAVARYRELLIKLSKGGNAKGEAARVRKLWGGDKADRKKLRTAAERVRFQRGQSDRVRAGLIRAGRWRDHIDAVLDQHGVPAELAALPIVESAYNPEARSFVGASGLWQFMPGTAKLYLPMSDAVDGRNDPFAASEAAARLLADNYRATGTWPLAITSYNHGAGGMKRAREQLGTSDFYRIWRDYRGRTFGFASRNFYVSLLAASDVLADPERFFGKLQVDPPEATVGVTLEGFMSLDAAARTVGVSRQKLVEANPALLPPAIEGRRHLPKGYTLRVPKGNRSRQQIAALLRGGKQFSEQTRDGQHVVRRGETMSEIAERYGLSVRELAARNRIKRAGLIRPGQVLDVPTVASRGGPATSGQADAALTTETTAAAISAAAGGTGTATRDVARTHKVKRGETLSKIAQRFGVSEAELARRNGLRNRNALRVGQRLRIDAETEAAVAVADAVADDPDAETEPVTYVVRRGDSLSRIAKRFRVSERELLAMNDIKSRHLLRPGQTLIVARKSTGG